MYAIQQIGVEWIQYLQTFHPQLDGIMAFFAFFVKPEYFMVLIFPVLYWNFGHRFFIRLFIVILFDILLGEILRIGLAQPRPWWIAEMVPIDAVTSVYSSPAGYSSFSVLFFGYLAYHFKKKWITICSIFIIIATSVAKLYQAATLPDHLILGMLQGGLLLWLFIKYGELITNNWIKLPKAKAFVFTIAITILIYLITYGVTVFQLSYDLPTYMEKYKIIPSDRLSNGATVFASGFLISALLSLNINEINHSKLNLNIAIWKSVLTTVLGLAVIVLLFIILRPSSVNMFSNSWIIGMINIATAAIVAAWIYYIIPRHVLHGNTKFRILRSKYIL